MISKDYQDICNLISKTSPYIRIVGMIGKHGELLSEYRRAELQPLLDSKNMSYQFASIALNTNLEEAVDKSLDPVEFMWEERKKVQKVTSTIESLRVWISIDKKVVRSEILRIIDACFPIVKHYS